MLFRESNIRNAMHQVKRHIGHAYSTGMKWAGLIDGYAGVAGRLLNVLSPAMQKYGAGQAVQGITKGLQSYSEIRSKALGAHQEATNLHGNIKRAVPELGL